MLRTLKNFGLGLGVALLMVSCAKELEDVNPSSTLGAITTNAVVTNTVIGPYTVSDLSVATDGMTWSFTVQRTGTAQANGLSHLILNLRDCDGNIIPVTAEGVAEAEIAGQGGAFKLSDATLVMNYSEGNGTGCNMTGASGFVKYDNLNDVMSDGSAYTFTLKLTEKFYIESADVWVKAGNACYQGLVNGPGCPTEIGCSYTQGQLKNSVEFSSINISVGGHIYTGAETYSVMFPPSGNNINNQGGTRAAFAQVAAIKISEKMGKLLNTAPIATDLAIAETGFARLSKLNITTNPSGQLTEAEKAAAGRIDVWITANACDLKDAPIASPTVRRL